MPVNTAVSFQSASRARLGVETVTNSAQDDLMNAISCCLVAVDSSRSHVLLAGAEEYLACLNKKVRLAIELARQTANPMVLCEYDDRTVPSLEGCKDKEGLRPPDNSGEAVLCSQTDLGDG